MLPKRSTKLPNLLGKFKKTPGMLLNYEWSEAINQYIQYRKAIFSIAHNHLNGIETEVDILSIKKSIRSSKYLQNMLPRELYSKYNEIYKFKELDAELEQIYSKLHNKESIKQNNTLCDTNDTVTPTPTTTLQITTNPAEPKCGIPNNLRVCKLPISTLEGAINVLNNIRFRYSSKTNEWCVVPVDYVKHN